MSKAHLYAPLCVVAVSIVLAACGGDSSTRSAADSTPVSPSPPPSGNQPPQISGLPQGSTHADAHWHFQPTASDPDGDAMQFFVGNAPPWTAFDPATGRLEGTPGEGDVGEFSDIRISVTDGLETASLPVFAIEVLPNGASTGTATLSWTPPTERVDGSPLEAIASYKVLWGTSPGQYNRSHTIENPGVTTFIVENLSPGTWFFAVTARAQDGLESAPSREASKRIDG